MALNLLPEEEENVSIDKLTIKKSMRRYDRNEEAWGLQLPKTSTIRKESSRAKTIRELKLESVATDSNTSFSLPTLRSSVSVPTKRLAKTKKLSQGQAGTELPTNDDHNINVSLPLRERLANIYDDFKDEIRKIRTSVYIDPYVKVNNDNINNFYVRCLTEY